MIKSITVVWLVALGLAAPVPGRAQQRTPSETLARDIFRELIEINTTHSVGDNTAAARAMARRLLDAGLPSPDVQVLEPVGRKGNLVARLRGSGARRPILLLAHLDVVEAEPEDWTLDPFTFTEQDGFFYGRGTTDDKAQAAIWVAVVIRFLEEGYRPDRDIIVALTADEEGGPANGVRWLLDEHPELIDAEFTLNEGAGGQLRDGVKLANEVQASEKIYWSFQLEVTDPGGHSSVPTRDNTIYRLAAALTRIAQHEFPVRLNDITRSFFERTAGIEGGVIGEAMRGVLQTPSDPTAVEILAATPTYNARMRTTCVATMVDAGHAQNALPQRARAVVNCRVLPDADLQTIPRTLTRVIADERVKLTALNEPTPSPPSPLTPELLSTIERVTDQMWPGIPVIPTMLTGATDGLFLRNRGIPVYGVSGLFEEVDDVRAHGQDERIGVDSFYGGFEFLYRLVRALTSRESVRP